MLWDKPAETWLFELQKRSLEADARAIFESFHLTLKLLLEISESIVESRDSDGAIVPDEQLASVTGCPSDSVHQVEVALILLGFADSTGSYVVEYPTSHRMTKHSSALSQEFA